MKKMLRRWFYREILGMCETCGGNVMYADMGDGAAVCMKNRCS